MTYATNDAGQTAQIFATLADEAWQQLGSRPLADLTVAEIAAHVDVEAGLAVAVAGDPQQLVLRKMAALDDQAVLESFVDIEDAGAVPIREKILEAILNRFEVYSPYRPQIQALNRAARARPDLALALGLGLQAVTRRMLAMAGDDCDGWRGLLRHRVKKPKRWRYSPRAATLIRWPMLKLRAISTWRRAARMTR